MTSESDASEAVQDPAKLEDLEIRRYRQAGFLYLVLGTSVLAVTVASPGLASPERRADIAHLMVGLPVFALFAAAIAWGHKVLGTWLREKLVMLLTVSAIGRCAVFLANALGYKPRLAGGLRLEAVEPSPRMWINVLLMLIIATALARASWGPFLSRWRRD